jgi:2-polyprenyl-3-methyl-5-hydroxy-6-metoxy-1,4-benzoquinol methylase
MSNQFEVSYQTGTAPWDIGRPQPDFLALAESGALSGRVLDVGCGTGEHAITAAGLGLDTTGVDSAPTAIATAKSKASERGVTVRFVVGDALDLSALGEQFDTVLDCGLFHVFDDEDRRRFVSSLSQAIGAGGRYFMLCFSDKTPGDWGPRRVTQEEIRASFSDGWNVDSIVPGRLFVTFMEQPVLSWLATITRT